MSSIGIDFGSKRIGIATSDSSESLAMPLTTLPGEDAALQWLRVECKERHVDVCVVGLPKEMSGKEGAAAQRARNFAKRLQREIASQVLLWDERLSSKEAERYLRSAGRQPSREKARVDAVAAAVLLQSWLDSRLSGGARL